MSESLNNKETRPMKTPTPRQIKRARIKAGLTQQEAADLIYGKRESWSRCENDNMIMHLAFWDLFLRKTKELISRVESN